MFHAEFVFDDRRVRNQHSSLREATGAAGHTLAGWEMVPEVKMLGDPRDGDPVLHTLTRS